MAPTYITTGEVASLIVHQLGKRYDPGLALDDDTSLEGVGLSSLDITEVYFAIEEHVGAELDPAAASAVKTIGDLVEVVNGLVAQAVPAAEPA